jgi:hypothetical protein
MSGMAPNVLEVGCALFLKPNGGFWGSALQTFRYFSRGSPANVSNGFAYHIKRLIEHAIRFQ